jgi:hypothetical protein
MKTAMTVVRDLVASTPRRHRPPAVHDRLDGLDVILA